MHIYLPLRSEAPALLLNSFSVQDDYYSMFVSKLKKNFCCTDLLKIMKDDELEEEDETFQRAPSLVKTKVDARNEEKREQVSKIF